MADNKIVVDISAGEQTVPEAADKASASLTDLKKSTAQSGEAVELHNVHTREMHRLFGELNKIAPGLGEILHATFAGPIGPLLIITGLIGEATAAMKNFNAELDKQGDSDAQANFLGAMEDRIEVFRNAVTAADAYKGKLDDIARSENTLKTALTEQLAVDQAIERARAGLTSAQKELDIAKVQAAEAGGKISPEQAAQDRANIEKKYNDQAQKDRETAQDKELNDKQVTLNDALMQQRGLEEKHNAAEDAKVQDEAHKKAVIKIFGMPEDDFEKQVADAEAAVNKALAALDKLNADQRAGSYKNEEDVYQRQLVVAQSDLDAARGNVNLLNRGRAQFNQATGPQSIPRTDALARAAKDTGDDATQNKQLIKDLTAQVTQMRAERTASRPMEEQATATKDAAVDEQEVARQEEALKREVATVTDYTKGKRTTPETLTAATKAIQDLKEVLEGIGPMAEFLNSLGFNMQQAQQAIQKLQADQSQLRNQTAQTGSYR